MKTLFLAFFLFLVHPIYSQTLNLNQKIHDLSHIWKDVSNYYHAPERLQEINWDSLYYAYISLISSCTNDKEYMLLLQRFLANIGDGHTEIFDLNRYLWNYHSAASLPFIVQWINSNLYITGVIKTIEGDIPLGSQIIQINHLTPEIYFQKNIYPYICARSIQYKKKKAAELFEFIKENGDSIHLVFNTPSEKKCEQWFKYTNQKRKKSEYNLIDPSIGIPQISFFPVKEDKKNFYYFRFDNFFNSHLNAIDYKAISQCDYVVLDLRNNSGGSELFADSLLMHFLHTDTLFTYKSTTRTLNAFYAAMGYGYKQYKDYYFEQTKQVLAGDTLIRPSWPYIDKPLFILISENTCSAAEDFLITLKSRFPKRAILVGTSTAGTTGAPLVKKLSNGYMYRICTRWPLVPDGLFNNGIQPDYAFVPTIQDLLNREDKILTFVNNLYLEIYENK